MTSAPAATPNVVPKPTAPSTPPKEEDNRSWAARIPWNIVAPSVAAIVVVALIGWMFDLQNTIHDEVDEAEQLLQTQIGQNVSAINTKMENINRAVDNNTNQLGKLDQTVTSLEKTVETVAGKVETLENIVNKMDGKLDVVLERAQIPQSYPSAGLVED